VSATNIIGPNPVSPVQQLLNSEKAAAAASSTNTSTTPSGPSASDPTDYQDQDWYITGQVNQLKAEISLYSTLPGLDPSGTILDSLTKQVNDLVTKQNAKVQQAKDEAAAKQKELDSVNAQNALNASIPTSDQLLQRAKAWASGQVLLPFAPPPDPTTAPGASDGKVLSSSDMLAKVGAKVDTTA
jgi:hypothetical protein